MTGGERFARGNPAGERVIVAVGAGRPAVVDQPAHRLARTEGHKHTQPERVVHSVVDGRAEALGSPRAISGADAVTSDVGVPIGVGQNGAQAISQRASDRVGQRFGDRHQIVG